MKEILNKILNKRKTISKKIRFFWIMDNTNFGKKIATLAKKAELKAEQDKIVKLQAFRSSYFLGKSHFEDDYTQHYLVF